jgi:hypothetical protein
MPKFNENLLDFGPRYPDFFMKDPLISYES